MAEAAVAEQSTTARPAAAEGTGRFASLPRWATGTFWIWPALLTLGFGIRGSWRPELWRDELASWSAAERSTGELWNMLGHVDAVSGAYYLLLHFWIGWFGDSVASMRLPSALAMAGSAAFVALTGRKLFNTWAGLVAGLLFAIVPSVSVYSQQVRGYAFVVLFVAAGTWALLRAVERPTWPRWLGYAFCVAMAGLFHMISLVFLLPHAIIVLLRWRESGNRKLLWAFPAAVVVALAPLVPLVIIGQRQVGRQISWIQTPVLDSFPDFWSGVFGSPLVSAIFLAMTVMPLAWNTSRRRALEIGVTAALPIGAVYLISQGSTSYFMDRYLLFTVPAWCVVAGAAVTAMRPRVVMAVVFLLGTGYLGMEAQQDLRKTQSHERSDERAAARLIAKDYRQGDGIVPVRGDQAYMMMDHAMEYYLPRSVKPVDVFAAQSPIQRNDLFASDCADPNACIGSLQRIWMVTFADGDDPYKGMPAAEADALKAKFDVYQTNKVRAITVTLLERKH
ncbi:glycosyltransferase family 39 protein [Kitasatospora sp. NPDC006697]|uniref:glycosyltransferase family 39 protein n=1 Tax=Kitasatospora sp. NPDC006697 TaxID=3364020 RepID=UPI00369E698E